MNVHPSRVGWATLALALSARLLCAQDAGPAFAFKVHGGLAAGDLQKLQHDNKIFGFGAEGRFSLGGTRAFTVELGFDSIPGRDHDAMALDAPLHLQAGVVDAAGQAVGNRPVKLDVEDSIDFRKSSTQGFSLRGAYTDALPGAHGWYWFAGASLDFHRTTGQFSGTLAPRLVTPVTPSGGGEPVAALKDAAGNDYYEGWAIVQDVSKVNFGLLGGVGVPLGENLAFEVTVRNLGFTHLDYRPATTSGRPAGLEQSTRRGFTFELGLSLKI